MCWHVSTLDMLRSLLRSSSSRRVGVVMTSITCVYPVSSWFLCRTTDGFASPHWMVSLYLLHADGGQDSGRDRRLMASNDSDVVWILRWSRVSPEYGAVSNVCLYVCLTCAANTLLFAIELKTSSPRRHYRRGELEIRNSKMSGTLKQKLVRRATQPISKERALRSPQRPISKERESTEISPTTNRQGEREHWDLSNSQSTRRESTEISRTMRIDAAPWNMTG